MCFSHQNTKLLLSKSKQYLGHCGRRSSAIHANAECLNAVAGQQRDDAPGHAGHIALAESDGGAVALAKVVSIEVLCDG